MKFTNIKDKLLTLDVPSEIINLGDFDYIGELTAKKQRDAASIEYRTRGAFFRSNYERGILAYFLIKRFQIQSVLEFGTQRAYTTLCMARACSEQGGGIIDSIDPNLTEEYVVSLTKAFPSEWFGHIRFFKGIPEVVVTSEVKDKNYGLIVLNTEKTPTGIVNAFTSIKDKLNPNVIVVLDASEEVTEALPHLVGETELNDLGFDVECVQMDRMLYPDDRDPEIIRKPYGQVVIQHRDLKVDKW